MQSTRNSGSNSNSGTLIPFLTTAPRNALRMEDENRVNVEEQFLGRRGGLPSTKARLIEMARALGLDTNRKSVAQLRSAIRVALGRSTEAQEQQQGQQRRDRSRSQRRNARENQRRSDERRVANQAVATIQEKLRKLVAGAYDNELDYNKVSFHRNMSCETYAFLVGTCAPFCFFIWTLWTRSGPYALFVCER